MSDNDRVEIFVIHGDKEKDDRFGYRMFDEYDNIVAESQTTYHSEHAAIIAAIFARITIIAIGEPVKAIDPKIYDNCNFVRKISVECLNELKKPCSVFLQQLTSQVPKQLTSQLTSQLPKQLTSQLTKQLMSQLTPQLTRVHRKKL